MPTGFNNIEGAQSAAFRSATSWGRTRQPKNVTGTQNGAVTLNTEYNTENQRFLLVYNSQQLTGGDIQVWSHALQHWVSAHTGNLAAATMHVIEIAGHDRVKVTNLRGGVVKLACTTF